MTYPPQPGQPGQPDPYGQQPQSGGFQQQPYPQQGGWDPNQQQQPYPTQQYPQGWDPNQQQAYPSGGFPANPQPQPQWDPNTQAWGDPNAQQQQQSAWADPNAQQYGQQAYPGGQMSGWEQQPGGYGQGFGGPPAPPKKSNTGLWIGIGVAVVVVLAAVGVTGFVTPGFFLSKDSNTAAPASTSGKPTAPKPTTPKKTTPTTKPSSPSGTGGGADAKGVLQGFIDKLNAGDNAGALALGCADSKDLLESWLKTFLKPPLQLQLGTVPDDQFLVEGPVTGTSAGKDVKGTLSATNFDNKGFCISTMLVS